MENVINKRVIELIRYLGISGNEFAKRINIPQTTFSNMINRDSDIKASIIKSIVTQFGDVSLEWLITGKGDMLINKEREQKMITVPEAAISQTEQKGALIYDIDATCGFDGRDINFADELVVGSIDIPEINSDSKIIVATGDSMQPLIYSGDRIVVRKIESWDYFNYGQVYLIITNEYRFIKRVRKHKDNPDSLIVLRSDNPNYDDVDLPKKEIIHLFIVENILAIKNIL